MSLRRREFLQSVIGCTALSYFDSLSMALASSGRSRSEAPNIVLCMSDDQGWGETGYYNHPIVKTANLDAMAASGMQFDRFYVAPLCMPTRSWCLTGRHPRRFGYQIKPEEVTLAELLKSKGYTTGHFGKWHLSQIRTPPENTPAPSKDYSGKKGLAMYFGEYVPPWRIGFDECFTSETNMSTWDPTEIPEHWKDRSKFGNYKRYPWSREFYTGPGQTVSENLEGCTDGIITDRAISFMQSAVKQKKPFLSVVWFYAPHRPVVGGKPYREMYKDLPEAQQHYFGCISAMDEQVGRIRKELRKLNIHENTMLLFCSDNGPNTYKPDGGRPHQFGKLGITKNLKGAKGTLFEGGVRVPAILEWPRVVRPGSKTSFPCGIVDVLPTVAAAVGDDLRSVPKPLDGISLMPLLKGKEGKREKPIGFEGFYGLEKDSMFMTHQYKIVRHKPSEPYALYDIINDPGERTDLAEEKPEVVKDLLNQLSAWRKSCNESLQGKDYQ